MQLLCAQASGCSPIIITDLSAERLEFAKNLVPSVFTYTVNPTTEPQQAAREIVKLFSDAAGMGSEVMPAVTMECTGVESSIAVASCKCMSRERKLLHQLTLRHFADATASSGLLFVIGVGKSHIQIP